MNTTPPLYRSDLKPVEFGLVVFLGSIGSWALSWVHVSAVWSVAFAVVIMSLLALLRWRIALERKDYQSLEAFAEDIYLLGYLLTLAALLGLAPRLMSDEANLFRIAGVKLVTTVFGLALMMIFRQTARRWAEEREGEESLKFIEQQKLFSEAVVRLNEGADQLTAKLGEVVHRFDPALLEPLADWSNRAAAAFSSATSHLEGVKTSVVTGLAQLDALNTSMAKANTTAAELAVKLGEAGVATGDLRQAVAALGPEGRTAGAALANLSAEAGSGTTQLSTVTAALHSTAGELGKVERALKKLLDLHSVDPNLPMNRLVEALSESAAHSGKVNERVGALNEGLQSFTAVNRDVASRMETHVGAPLAEHRQSLDRVQQQLLRTAEQMERMVKHLETSINKQPDGANARQLIAQLSELQAEMSQTNAHFQKLLARVDGGVGEEQRGSWWSRLRGGGSQ